MNLNPFRRRRSVGHKDRLTPDGLRIVEFPAGFQQMLRLYGVGGTYAEMWRRQPNVRSVIDLIARQAAEMSPKVYQKVPRSPSLPSGRLEVPEHPMAALLNEPRPGGSAYTFWFATFADIEIYDRAIWQKIRVNGGAPVALNRVPPSVLMPYRDPITMQVVWWMDARGNRILPEDLVVFWGYDPDSNFSQTSPMETLRRLLADEFAANSNREGMWKRSLRKDGVIEPELDAAKLADDARESYLLDLEDALAGPEGSGRPLLLEPGHHWKDATWSPREMEYISARRLSRVEVCAQFGVPPSAVAAHLQGQELGEETLKVINTFTLPPRLRRVESEIQAQLLPEFEFIPKQRRLTYTEFNMDVKMRGDLEGRAAVLATTAGGPIITVNEARARVNLPPIAGGDQIFVPLNSVRAGGPQASPQSPTQTPAPGIQPSGTTPGGGTAPGGAGPEPAGGTVNPTKATWLPEFADLDAILRMSEERAKAATRDSAHAAFVKEQLARYEERFTSVYQRTFDRQRPYLEHGDALKRERWDTELSDDIYSTAYPAVSTIGENAAKAVGGQFVPERTSALVRKMSDEVAVAVNDQTEQIMKDGGAVDNALSNGRARQLGAARANWAVNWAVREAAHQNGG